MKKFIATTLIAAMMLTLTACSDEAKKTAQDAATVAQGVADAAEGIYLKDINPADYVTLGNYVGLTPTFEKEVITDEKVQQYMEGLPAQYPEQKDITDRDVAQNGDVANIDYEGKLDGVAFDGGTAQGYDLPLGSGVFIPGFEEGVVGMKVGETKDLELTFPEDYGSADLAGKTTIFTVKLNSLKEEVIPELNDEFAVSLGETDLEGLRNAIKTSMEQSAESDYQSRLMDDLEKQVKEASTFHDIPEAYVDSMYAQYMESLSQYAAQAGATEGQVAAYFFGVSEDDYETGMREWASEMAENYIMLAAIAAENNITITDEEVDADIQEMLTSNGSDMTVEEYKEQMDFIEAYKENMLVMKVEDFIVSKAAVQ